MKSIFISKVDYMPIPPEAIRLGGFEYSESDGPAVQSLLHRGEHFGKSIATISQVTVPIHQVNIRENGHEKQIEVCFRENINDIFPIEKIMESWKFWQGENEVLERENIKLKVKIKAFENMGFVDRFKFLFTKK